MGAGTGGEIIDEPESSPSTRRPTTRPSGMTRLA